MVKRRNALREKIETGKNEKNKMENEMLETNILIDLTLSCVRGKASTKLQEISMKESSCNKERKK